MRDDYFALDDFSPTRRPWRGFRHAVTSWGAWHLVVQILALPAPASGFRKPVLLIICLPKKLDIFSTQDHGSLSPEPLLMSFYGKHLQVLRKNNNNNNRENGLTFKHSNKIIWACFGQYKARHQLLTMRAKGDICSSCSTLSPALPPVCHTVVHLGCKQVKIYSTWFPTFS